MSLERARKIKLLLFDVDGAGKVRFERQPLPTAVDAAESRLALADFAEMGRVGVHPEALVVRTSLLYGKPEPGPQELLAFRDDLDFFTDEIRCPTRVDDLAWALLELAGDGTAGVLHLAAPDAVSRYELARRLRTAHGFDPSSIRGVPSPRIGRARNVALDSSRAAGILGRPLRGIVGG